MSPYPVYRIGNFGSIETRLRIGNFGSIETRLQQLGVEVAVFQQQNMNRQIAQSQASVTFIGPVVRIWPGEGSFKMAQNIPRSRIATKNSWKSTGLTTKAFTPRS